MKGKFTKIVGLCLCVIMAAGMLAACTPATPAATTPAATTKAPGSTTAAVTTTVATTAVLKPVDLTVEVFDRATTGQTPVDNNYWTAYIQKTFGTPNKVTMKFMACPRSKEVDTLNTWMAGGTAPDICFTYDLNVVYNYYKQNGLSDLTAAMGTYGKNLSTFLGKDLLAYGQYDGKQISIPAKRIMQARAGAFIRQDLLDLMGMAMPDTTDQFYAYLKAIKEKNPGKVDKVVPFAMTYDVAWCAQGFLESFRTPATDRDLYIKQNIFLPGYKEGVQFLNKMYNEGLISPEFALDKDGKGMDADIIRGAAGAYESNYDMALRSVPGHIANLVKNIPTAKLVAADPYTNYTTGKHTKQLYDPSGIRLIVPVFSKNTETVIKYLDWMTGKDVLFFLQNGNEGVGHTLVEGLPKVQAVTGEQMFPSPQNIDYTLILNGVELGDQTKTIKVNSFSYPGNEALFIKAVEYANRDAYVFPALSTPVDAAAKFGTSLTAKEKEIFAKSITCTPADFDKVWSAQTAEYQNMGGAQVTTERAAAWDKAHP